jgi:hypothetical protein
MSLPAGKIGNVRISRLICGSNPIIGSAHDRDLIYIPALMRHYFTDRRIMDLWQTCEECGINTMIGPADSPYAFGEDPTMRVYTRYCTERRGKIQWIAQTYPSDTDLTTSIRKAIDNGAVGAFIQGNVAERWVRRDQIDLLAKAVDFIRANGLIAGCACHMLEAAKVIEKAAIELDFYMKTLHSDNYWSATPRAELPQEGLPPHDNMWCTRPEETVEFMRIVGKPWIAFKVLAAGAIHPRDGFHFAFENGADFVNVGMFDFQVRENAVLASDIISEIDKKGRARPWMGLPS